MEEMKNNYNTEKIEDKSYLEELSIDDLLAKINSQDAEIPKLIKAHLDQIGTVIEAMKLCIKNKGRIVYVGSGTSGSLACLDAMEIKPTYGVDGIFVAIHNQYGIQKSALDMMDKIFPERDVEEDTVDQHLKDLKEINFSSADMIIGISASGRTPYVVKALEYAKSLSAKTASICMNHESLLAKIVDYPICIETGPEIVAGSTRMKAGTVQKMVLNMLSTATMIQSGFTYHNMMVGIDVRNNSKMMDRAVRIVMKITNSADYEFVKKVLLKAGKNVKVACLMILKDINCEKATKQIELAHNNLSVALKK